MNVISQPPTAPRPTPAVDAILAPLIGVVRPAKAARRLLGASATALCCSYAFYAVLFACLVLALVLYDQTLTQRWITLPTPAAAPAATTAPTTAPATPTALATMPYATSMPVPATLMWTSELQTRTAAQVWAEWHKQGWFGPAEGILLGSFFGILAAAAISSGLFLPFVHRTEPLGRAFRRSFCAHLAAGGAVLMLTLVVGSVMVAATRIERSGGPWAHTLWIQMPVIVGFPLALFSLAGGLHRAAAGIARDDPAPEIPPRCEGCGYDLTHQGIEARCPECGLGVASSLTENLRRPGSAWERRYHSGGRFQRWWREAQQIIFSPTAYYGALQMRTDLGPARAFVRFHYLFVAVSTVITAWAIGIVVFIIQWDGDWEPEGVIGVPLVMLCWVSLFLWTGHKLAASITLICWQVRGLLPDYLWARKVFAYESAYSWVVGLFWLGMFTSFLLFDDWLSQMKVPWLAGAPPEAGFVFLGTLALHLLWFLRYAWILRAIRWNNY